MHRIAVSEVVQRLTSKCTYSVCISRVVNVEASKTLSLLQFGVGVPIGCEANVHAMNNVHDDSSVPSKSKWTPPGFLQHLHLH